MKTINMKDWIRSVIESKQRIAVPILTHSGIEMIGANVVNAVTDGAIHYEAMKILSDTYASAASTVIMDLTVEAEAFGATVAFSENEAPTVVGRLLLDRQSIEELEIPKLTQGRIPEYLKANKLAVENLAKPVLSGCIGPFSLAGRLFGMSEIMMEMYIDPEATRLLLQKCTSFILSYCKDFKEIGTQGVIIAEPAAGLLSNDACQDFSSVYVKQVVDEIQDDRFSVILHNCGNSGHCTEAMLNVGAAGYHFGNVINILDAIAACPPDVLVMGNLDPVSIFKMASATEVYNATTMLLEKTAPYPNFVLSSGCDIPPHIPFDNIEAFYNALKNYNLKNN